ncbi:protein YciI [Gammaproteobacteria bacterium]
MLYAILSEDAPNTLEARRSVRPAHLARLQTLRDQGRLVLAGPHPAIDAEDPGTAGFTGSLVVAEFPSLEAAHTWAAADPYVDAGIYVRVVVKPFRKVLP